MHPGRVLFTFRAFLFDYFSIYDIRHHHIFVHSLDRFTIHGCGECDQLIRIPTDTHHLGIFWSVHIFSNKRFEMGLDIRLIDRWFLHKLFNLSTLTEFFLFGVQMIHDRLCQLMSPPTKVFTEPITTTPECFAETETLLKDHVPTDDEPHMIRTVFPPEIFTVFGIGRH